MQTNGMQLKIYTISLLLFWGVLTFISCQKELSCEACAETNKPPVANAGRDTIIILPVDSIMLDGTASHDPENNITAYQWTKISGPSSVYIVNSNASKTQVVSLVEGTYEFELKVTDGGSLFSRDTIQITVKEAVAPVYCDNFNRPEINTRLIPIGILPKFRSGMTIASAGNKIFFAGGYTNNSGQFSWVDSRVDIHDISTNTWSTAELSVPRYWITAIATGNKVFFAGGMSGDLDWLPDYHATVDIYDVGTSTWSVTNMSEAKSGVAAAAVGSKVFFAGGAGKETIDNTSYWGILKDDVEVYDFSTNTWSVSKLSEAKHGISAVSANNKIYFAGGGAGHLLEPPHFTSRIEIFDNASGTWAISYLSEPKVTTGIAVGNKIYYGGGWLLLLFYVLLYH